MKKFRVLMAVLMIVCFTASVFAGSSGFGTRMEDLLERITAEEETVDQSEDSGTLASRYQNLRDYIRENYRSESNVTDSGVKAYITGEQYSKKNSTLKSDGAVTNTLYRQGFGTSDGADMTKRYTDGRITSSGTSTGNWGTRWDYSASGGQATENKYAAANVVFDRTGGENGRYYELDENGKKRRISNDEAMRRLQPTADQRAMTTLGITTNANGQMVRNGQVLSEDEAKKLIDRQKAKDNIDIRVGAGITWAEKKVDGKAGLYDSVGGTTELIGGIDAQGEAGYLVGARGEAKAGLYSDVWVGKDGKVHTFNGARANVDAFVGAEANASGSLSKQVGDVTLGLGGNASAQVGAGATGNAVAGIEDGKLVAGVDGELFAGARAKGDVSASAEYGGVKGSVTASGNVGVGLGIGGRCKVKIGWDGISWDVGANAYLGVGGGIGVKGSLDFSKALAPVKEYVTERALPVAREVVSNVREAATDVRNGVVNAARTVATTASNVANTVANTASNAAQTVATGIANTTRAAASTVSNAAKNVKSFFSNMF